MELKFVDPRSLKDNPDKARRSKSSPQADALLLATIKAVGIVQPPVGKALRDLIVDLPAAVLRNGADCLLELRQALAGPNLDGH